MGVVGVGGGRDGDGTLVVERAKGARVRVLFGSRRSTADEERMGCLVPAMRAADGEVAMSGKAASATATMPTSKNDLPMRRWIDARVSLTGARVIVSRLGIVAPLFFMPIKMAATCQRCF